MLRSVTERIRRARATVAVAAGLLLAACVAQPADRPAHDVTAVIEDKPTATDGLRTDLPPRPPDSPAEPPAPPPPEPTELVGLAARDVTRRLGSPAHVWREPPAHVWQYTVDGCVLHLFMYPDGGDLTVSHIEIQPMLGGADPPDADFSAARCYGAMLASGGG